MTEGLVAHRLTFILALTTLVLALNMAAFARSSRSSAGLPVTVLSVSGGRLQVTGGDGQAMTLTITPASLFLRRGLLVSADEFTPGETALLRQRKGAGGRAQVVLLCDTDSAAVLEKYRRRPLSGTVLSASSGVWVVQPSDAADLVPLTLRLSAHTTFQAGGESVPPSAFGPGAAVTVTTRGLPDGLLLAVSVAEASEAEAAPVQTRILRFVSGQVTDVEPDAGTLTVQDKTGTAHVVAADGRTRIKVRRQPAALTDIQMGMRVSVWLGTDQDASGNPIAASLSAYDGREKKTR